MPKKKTVHYGHALRALMGVREIKGADLAKRIGKSPQYVSYYRNRESWPSDVMAEICAALDVTQDQLADLSKKMRNIS